MNFKPGDFFLGIVDFLGVLVPGAVLVFLEADWLRRAFGTSPLLAHWLVFAAAAYFLGHLLLAVTEFLNGLGKRFAGRVFHQTQEAAKILEGVSRPLLGKAATEHPGIVFHAALSFLRLKNADAAAEIDRHMAGYKLLRCLVAVFFIDLILTIPKFREFRLRLPADFILVALLFVAFVRMLQWANLLAFQYCILIDEQKPPSPSPPNPAH